MADLRTTFAGLSLRNPIIVSSSGLTNSAAKNKRHEEAGAGAVVLKSLFEEQVLLDAGQMVDSGYMDTEAVDYLPQYVRAHKLADYTRLIEETKKLCRIPVIASVNCYSNEGWIDFAQTMERAGADALEVNILALQTDVCYQYGSFEQRHIDTLRSLKENLTIPIIMKLGSNFTNPVTLIDQLYANGAAGVVLFNRPFQPDIDIHKMVQSSGSVFSNGSELSNVLRWIGITSVAVNRIDYAASGGIHTGEAVIKALLSGAVATEICSALYLHGEKCIGRMLDEIRNWMHQNGFETISQFRGKLNCNDLSNITTFERTQFMRYFSDKPDGVD